MDDDYVNQGEERRLTLDAGTVDLATVTELHPRPTPVENAVAAWEQALMSSTQAAMDALAPNGVLPADPEDAGFILQVLRGFRQALAKYEALAESHLIARMQAEKLHVLATEGATFEIKGGSSGKKWDGPKLVADLVATAEAHDLPLRELANAITKVAGLDNASQTFRMTELKKYGLSVEDYCETTKGRSRIEIV